jgi:hypothetical protein
MGWMGRREFFIIVAITLIPLASRAPGPDQALQDAYLHGARLRRVGNAPGWAATKRPRWDEW